LLETECLLAEFHGIGSTRAVLPQLEMEKAFIR